MDKKEYQLYEPFYKKLVERYPDLSLVNYHFQFALPPIYLKCNNMGGEEFERLTDFYGYIISPFYMQGINSLSTSYFAGLDELYYHQQISLEEYPVMRFDTLLSKTDQIITKSSIVLDQNWQTDLKIWKSKTTFDFEETFHSEQWQEEPVEIKLGDQKYPLSEQLDQDEYSFTIKIKNMGLYRVNRPWLNEDLLKKMMLYWDQMQILIVDSVFVIQDIRMELELHCHSQSGVKLCQNDLHTVGQLYFLGMPVNVKDNKKIKMVATEYGSSVQVLGVLSKIIKKEVTK